MAVAATKFEMDAALQNIKTMSPAMYDYIVNESDMQQWVSHFCPDKFDLCPVMQLSCMAARQLGEIIPILSPWYKNRPHFVPNSVLVSACDNFSPMKAKYNPALADDMIDFRLWTLQLSGGEV